MIGPQPIESKIQLFVEGNDQRNLFEAFRDHLGLDHIQIQNFGGVDDLRDFLLRLAASNEFITMVEGIGIVRDAERSPQSAFQSVQNSLRNAGLPVPSRPREREHSDAAAPAVTVLILPHDDRLGMLETLLCQTLTGQMNDCIDSYFDCVQGLPDVDMRRPHKARAHAYIATQPEPNLSVGVAAKRDYWDFEHSAFTVVRRFLETL